MVQVRDQDYQEKPVHRSLTKKRVPFSGRVYPVKNNPGISRSCYLYSSQLFIFRSSPLSLQKARIKALASLAFVSSGTLKSTALRLME